MIVSLGIIVGVILGHFLRYCCTSHGACIGKLVQSPLLPLPHRALRSFVGWTLSAVPIERPFAGGALLGMLVGRAIAPRIAGPKLQPGFAGFATLVAVGLVLKTLLTVHI